MASSNGISAMKVAEAFLKRLEGNQEAIGAWDDKNANTPWTDISTKLFTEVLREAGYDTAGKGMPDKYGRSEYFTVDVVGYSDSTWQPPAVAVEIENYPQNQNRDVTQAEYCAWKLISIDCRERILMTYFDHNSYNTLPPDTDWFVERVAKIVDANPTKPVVMMLGDNAKWAKNTGWSEVFQVIRLPG